MKKISIFLILFIFSLCMVTGFLLARQYSTRFPASSPTQVSDTILKPQQNLLLLHFSQMKSNPPNLVSAWIVFLNTTNTPSLTFVPVFQNNGSPPPDLFNGMTFKTDGSLTEASLKDIESRLKVPIDGYIALDDVALVSFASRLPPPNPPPPLSVSTEHGILTELCHYLKNTPDSGKIDFSWAEVLPDHFKTSLKFDAFMADWVHITQSDNQPLCEVN